MVTLENPHVKEILQITVSRTQMIIYMYNCKLFSAASFLKVGQQQNSFERKKFWV